MSARRLATEGLLVNKIVAVLRVAFESKSFRRVDPGISTLLLIVLGCILQA